ncbi:MAG TPA: hypothetical protein VGC87_15590 [Pyrinomonadaceae bacterium]|jgi:hypothetical protein
MRRAKQQPEPEKAKDENDSLPLRIVPVVDRLARVKNWLRVREGRNPPSNNQILKFPGRVAASIAKTYAERGDGATLPDDVALRRIKDLLLELDEGIINRNQRRR